MGRSRTVRFVEVKRVRRGYVTDCEWQTKFAGRPTDANLAKAIALYNETLKPGGVNEHVGESATCVYAEVRDQFNGNAVLATWKAV